MELIIWNHSMLKLTHTVGASNHNIKFLCSWRWKRLEHRNLILWLDGLGVGCVYFLRRPPILFKCSRCLSILNI
jgi:hypothetical protein